MPLSRDEVVRAAVRQLDDAGLDGLTLRRLATRLGVSAPTLYWHVKDKRELLDLMAEAIINEVPAPTEPAPGQPWWDWLADCATAQYRAVVRHRDAALVVAGNRPTERSLPRIEGVMSVLAEAGVAPGEALECMLIIGNYVIGTAMEYQAEATRVRGARDAALAMRIRDSTDLPHLVAAARMRGAPNPDATFRRGLELIISGIRERHREPRD